MSSKTLYHIDAHNNEAVPVNLSSLPPNESKWELLPQMPNSVLEPQAFFLCGKLYCLGGHEENKPWAMAPWAMACKPTLKTGESLPEHPSHPSSQNRDLFSAAMEGPRPSIACSGNMLRLSL